MRLPALVVLALMAFTSGGQPVRSRVPRAALAQLEAKFDGRFTQPGQADPFDLLGNTRAVYLGGYGVVFTAELSLILTPPITPFRQAITKDDIEKIHRRKLAKLEILKKNMREMMAEAASSLDGLPPGEQVVFAVTLFYYSWEQRSGLPSQIIMQAPKQVLTRGPADAAVRIEEL